MTRPRHLLHPAQLFPEKKYPMRESLLPVGLELAEAFTGKSTPLKCTERRKP
jgi:hypothetical protein